MPPMIRQNQDRDEREPCPAAGPRSPARRRRAGLATPERSNTIAGEDEQRDRDQRVLWRPRCRLVPTIRERGEVEPEHDADRAGDTFERHRDRRADHRERGEGEGGRRTLGIHQRARPAEGRDRAPDHPAEDRQREQRQPHGVRSRPVASAPGEVLAPVPFVVGHLGRRNKTISANIAVVAASVTASAAIRVRRPHPVEEKVMADVLVRREGRRGADEGHEHEQEDRELLVKAKETLVR